MIRTKKFAILRKDRTILVKTPVPYVIDVYKDFYEYSKEDLEQFRHRMNENTKFLYNCLKMLGISKKEAISKDYSLNLSTGEKLRDISIVNKNISLEMSRLIINHKW
jgi:ABC-type dipeptide/oligopeptide/nickel transport system ATPase component